MQRTLRTMIGYAIRATDGDLGKIDEFYFDDRTWTIRYLIVDTGSWLASRKRVLISPHALGEVDWESKTFSVKLSGQQVLDSPDIDTKRPVHRQHEADLARYYQWPFYWESGYGGMLGVSSFPLFEDDISKINPETGRDDDPRLRSTHSVTGYQIHATDGDIGSVRDFVVDDQSWTIPYLIVDTGTWLPGRKVLISPSWITKVDWATMSAFVSHTREDVRNSPEFNPDAERWLEPALVHKYQ